MTAKSESKKDAMMTMSADTLAARIRERAKEYRLKNQMFDGGIGIRRFRADEVEDLMAAFALSELSAAEQAARKEEREECAQIAERMNAIGADRIGDAIRNRE